jgi:long-chain acyl-CoA synthetase
VAAVILKEPGAVTPEELKKWTNERVGAKYQRLDRVILMEDFPRSTAGKTLKRVMREELPKGI